MGAKCIWWLEPLAELHYTAGELIEPDSTLNFSIIIFPFFFILIHWALTCLLLPGPPLIVSIYHKRGKFGNSLLTLSKSSTKLAKLKAKADEGEERGRRRNFSCSFSGTASGSVAQILSSFLRAECSYHSYGLTRSYHSSVCFDLQSISFTFATPM